MRVAKATQAPGQTKEQTKLIAKGIEKGIALYKQQQKEKARERDRARKRALKQAQARSGQDGPEEAADDAMDVSAGSGRAALFTAAALFLLAGLAHLLRWFLGWEVLIAGWTLPLAVSLLAGVVLLVLGAWMIRCAARDE
jgi:hypothetical protein